MLDVAVTFLADQFNAYLLRRTGSASLGQVVPGGILDEKGNLAIASGTVRLCLVNIEEERVLREQVPARIMRNGREMVLQPELKLNLTLLFAARMNDYPLTLKALSNVLTFFQSHPAFSADDYPALDSRIGKIVMELYSVTPETLNQIWASVGAKYQPSVLYRARLVTIQDQEPFMPGAPITDIGLELHEK
ncbi:DUF4255 domain-containing protein [Ferribacterium limneticum]|uniref:DUF4255 domain-containing protein n=1 Tax=Ferribacterium limneticum TaxID=76259 RepID=UPI001CFC3D67|nr:DUF4255 domain-containing protein [Ferribacterium limneticum]UCV27924.1 DUF4255 domain-containing protein [Ferribacterium limneticum]UCV31841.1 DUF4255 domain-containing protein [Ferribacterium limneticum]